MSWRFGSLTDFRGDCREEGLVFCLEKRGDPEEPRGDSGGVPLFRNTDGNALPQAILRLAQFLDTLTGVLDLVSSINDLTCIKITQMNYQKKGKYHFHQKFLSHMTDSQP